MRAKDLGSALGAVTALDRMAAPVRDLVARAVPQGAVKDLLSGTWLGHPAHPMLTDIPIGSFSSAAVLDLLGGRRGQRSADMLVALGIVSAVPTAAAGAADWSDTVGADTRVGFVHATANAVGLAFYLASLGARMSGRRARGRLLGLAGLGTMTVGGYLGGHLSYERGIGVNNGFWQHGPDEWTPVLDHSSLGEHEPVRVEVADATVVLYRSAGRILAISSRCTHAGGPLEEGAVDELRECVTCPWHQSVFSLTDGSVVHGPARTPQPAYDTRVVAGRIEVRRRPLAAAAA